MNPAWQDFLGAHGARITDAAIADFGDPAAELAAAASATVIAPLSHLGLIECSGDDARSFLHNQLTSDVNHLGNGQAQYAAWCSAKGRMLASFVLLHRNGGFLGVLSGDLQEAIQKRLQIYVLRSKVKLSNPTPDHAIIGLAGAQADAALQAAALPIVPPSDGVSGAKTPSALSAVEFPDGVLVRLDGRRYLIIVPVAAAPALWQRLAAHAKPVGVPAWTWLDVDAGIPWITAATKEAFVPQMANFDAIGGVNFQKGCYPGQEVVARARYLGQVKRHLYRVHAEAPIAAGQPLFHAGAPEQACGQIAVAAPAPGGGHDALAVIHDDPANGGDLCVRPVDGSSIGLSAVAPVQATEPDQATSISTGV